LTIKDWTDFNYKLLGEAINRITGGDALSEELLHYTLAAFLERPDVQAIVDSNGGFYFCLRIATNSWKSTTSPFYRQYRDPNPRQELKDKYIMIGYEWQLDDSETPFDLPQDSTLQEEDLYKQIDTLLKDLNWYESELTRAYAEHNCNASLLAKVTNIPRTSINLTLTRVRAHIKEKLSHE